MNVEGDLIWGDDGESEVFAQVHSHDLCIIFRFSWNSKFPQSLPSRIVTCFHELPAKDACETFPDRASMREALYSSIRGVWDQCTRHPSVTSADVTIEIYEDAERQTQWRISHESLYDQYVESLLPISGLFTDKEAELQAYNTIDYSSLVHIRHPGGRGRTAVVRSSETLYVFKGVDFGLFLESQANFKLQKDVCYHEIRTISSLPAHPNIVAPSNTFVTVRKIDDDQQAFVCGALYPFMEHGTVEDQIQNAQATGARLPLISKAAWCFQMASAIAHAHFTAHTFHMDIKPANFVLNAHKDLILIDWEQSGAPLYTLAPEADGSWDVKEMTIGSSKAGTAEPAEPKLVYEKYSGPHRENLAWGQPKWNVFPSWRDHYPRALNAAEVFSLGRTMWMLLEEVTQSEVEELDEVIVSWSAFADDIPEDWKGVVSRCLDPDPNKRVELSELVDFWKAVTCKAGRIQSRLDNVIHLESVVQHCDTKALITSTSHI
ncbi:MAG: hypothetical protein Q9190_002399 [Brigantiaea leucoxantha]